MSTETTRRLDKTTARTVTVTVTTTTTADHTMTPTMWAVLARVSRRSWNLATSHMSAAQSKASHRLAAAGLVQWQGNVCHVTAVGLAVLCSRSGRIAVEKHGKA